MMQRLADLIDRMNGRPTKREREDAAYLATYKAERELLTSLGYREWLQDRMAVEVLREHTLEFRRVGSAETFEAKPAYIDPMFNIVGVWWRRPALVPDHHTIH